MDTIREQCEHCLSYNYIDNNVENLGFEAFECWNCLNRSFLPDEGLFHLMDRLSLEEAESYRYLLHYPEDVHIVDGRSIP